MPNDICYAKKHADDTYEIIPGKYCSALYETIPDALSLLAKAGFHVIVDAFVTTRQEFLGYQEKLASYLRATVEKHNEKPDSLFNFRL